MDQQGCQAWSVDVPALTSNIFAAASYSTNILNKKGGMRHFQSIKWDVYDFGRFNLLIQK